LEYFLSLKQAMAGLFMVGTSYLWKSYFKDYSTDELFKAVLIIQIVAWGLQFVGHGFFESI
jgi:uncharacterized membrane protein YGL010W